VSRRATAQLVGVLLLLGCLAVAVLAPVPYLLLSPGPVVNTLGSTDTNGANIGAVLQIHGAPTYPTTGRLDLVTVSETGGPYGNVSLLAAIRGWFDSSVAVVPTSLYYPSGSTSQQVTQQNTVEMDTSQQNATVAALRQVGEPVTPHVQVGAITSGTPAAAHLRLGDIVLSINGVPATSPAQTRDQVGTGHVGQLVTMALLRSGHPLTVQLRTVPTPGDPTRPLIGFVPIEGYTSPVTVDIKLSDIGGPSAGLMFALGIVDKLTPRQLTGGEHIAGTGTITADGAVGEIGGIAQKMAGARNAGATLFLVPSGNCADAAAADPAGLRLIRVSSLSGAISEIGDVLAGRPGVPTC